MLTEEWVDYGIDEMWIDKLSGTELMYEARLTDQESDICFHYHYTSFRFHIEGIETHPSTSIV